MAKREMKKPNEDVIEVRDTVDEAVDTTIKEAVVELANGVVSNCSKLNLRSKPSLKAKVLSELVVKTKVQIDLEESNEEWYKVITEGRVQGYCMKKYITLK